MNGQTDWLTALAILAAGLIVGFLFLHYNRRRNVRTRGADADLLRADWEARRDELVGQLRDPALAPEERLRIEGETALILRKLDEAAPLERGAGTASANPVSSGFLPPALKGFAWGLSTFAVLGALGFFVMGQAAEKEVSAPVAPMASTVEDLQAKVQRAPNDLQLRNDLAQAQLQRDDLMAVFEETRFVLERSPEDSRALMLQAVVRSAMGDSELAVKMLLRAARSDPRNLDARIALAWVYAKDDRIGEGEKTIAAAVKEFPAEKAMLEQVLQQIRTHVATTARDAANTSPG
jgi:tetratricopeptide (TPR) repeat protein